MTTENILLTICRLGDSGISSFRKKVFNSPALRERLSSISAQIYTFNILEPFKVFIANYKLSCLYAEFRLTAETRNHAGNLFSLRTLKVSRFVWNDLCLFLLV